MAEFNLEIKIKSPLYLGSGEADLNTDADILHDDFGIPYFTGRRFKGLLYESILEVREMLLLSMGEENLNEINNLFHKKSDEKFKINSPQMFVNNFYPYKDNEYEKISAEWKYL